MTLESTDELRLIQMEVALIATDEVESGWRPTGDEILSLIDEVRRLRNLLVQMQEQEEIHKRGEARRKEIGLGYIDEEE